MPAIQESASAQELADAGFSTDAEREAAIAGLSGTYVPLARTITAGDGLAGGGDLSANRTIDVDATVIRGDGTIVTIVAVTQAEFDAIVTPDPDTWYVITDAAPSAPAAGAVGGPAITTRKSADEGVTSSTALQDDNHLSFAIGANEVWAARLVLIVACTSNTPDFKYQITVPAGATGSAAGNGLPAGATAATGSFVSYVLALGAAGSVAAINGSIVHVVDLYIANGATPGNVTLQWAQNTSDAATVTLKAGSMMTRQRIA